MLAISDHTKEASVSVTHRRLVDIARSGAVMAGVICLAAGLIISSCQKKQEAETPATDVIAHDSTSSADGVMVHYRVHGSGENTMVLVHGWSCDQSYWDAQVEGFIADFKVVTLDLGGHGLSGTMRETWDMPSYGADVAAVVEKLDLSNVILVGHSMGGAVIIEAARRLPGRVVALIGVDNFQNFAQRYQPEQIEQFLTPFRSDFAGATDQFVRSMFLPTADSALVHRVASDMASAPQEIALGAIEQFLQYDFVAALGDVRLPVRCVNSDAYPTNIEGNNQVAVSFKAKIMPGTGHFLHMENPAAFNGLLRETIAEFWPVEYER